LHLLKKGITEKDSLFLQSGNPLHRFKGGINGDNWDFQQITISNMDRSAIYFEKNGTFDRNGRMLIKRFTGSEKDLTLIF
jgi:hypothetical protein